MSNQPFPVTQNRFYAPILRFLSDSKTHKIEELRVKLINNFRLTDEQLKIKLSNGQDIVFSNRFRWARFHLKRAGLITSPSINELKITPGGLTVLKRKQKITRDTILPRDEIPVSEKHLQQGNNQLEDAKQIDIEKISSGKEDDSLPDESPDDQIQEIIDTTEKNLPNELLKLLRAKDSAFFEKVVIELVENLYGNVEQSEHPGGSDDKGIDGIVKPDKFGFEAIYIQAKRYKEGNMVGRSDLSKFVGDLTRHGALRGIFITTSGFYSDALEFWKDLRNNPKVILINGKELVQLMIEKEVGIKPTQYTLRGIDEDFFNKE